MTEEDTSTFEGFLSYQGIDPSTCAAGDLKEWRAMFDEASDRAAKTPKIGSMKIRSLPGQELYAIAIEDGSGLWLTLWVRCAPKGDVYVIYPRADGQWNPHVSYHNDGRVHSKSFGQTGLKRRRQPLTGTFRGREHLCSLAGHGTKLGAVCDESKFTGIVRVEPGRLGAKDGCVSIDLLEPGLEPAEVRDEHIIRQVFRRPGKPSLVVTGGS